MNFWNQQNIPHKGWTLIDFYSHDYPVHKCEMCGQEDIVNVFVMQHKTEDIRFEVGCVCAEKMLNDYVNPKKYQSTFIKWKKRKENWPNLKWYRTVKGNIDIKKDGNHVVIFTNNNIDGFKLIINKQFGKGIYKNIYEAKMAAFYYLYPLNLNIK